MTRLLSEEHHASDARDAHEPWYLESGPRGRLREMTAYVKTTDMLAEST
jgi:hypothetical protein